MSLASVGCFRSTLKVLSKDMHSYTITRTNKMRLHHKSDSQSINLYKNANTKIRKMLFSNTSDHVKEKDKIDMSKFPVENIRNFCIIAHVDHGKSTLADRLLEITGAIVKRSDNKQVLDKLQVERERGITVKAQTASLFYEYRGKTYLLNLIDTPGHVDFNYEVSRSLSACQGALLLVDANQGVQAQTVANFFLAFDSELTVIPVLNKIDLKNADPEMCIAQMKTVFDMSREEILLVSAKLGMGVEELLHEIIERIPPPRADVLSPLKALVFDSSYDRYKGVIANAAILDGQVKVGDRVTFAFTQKNYEVQKLGVMRPQEELVNSLYAGQIGFIIVNMKNASEACVGDTFFLQGKPVEAIHGFKPAKPMVFAGVYPTDQSEFPALRSAVSRLTLNDSSVSVAMDASPALGQGFRLGFLGLLHMEVFNQRLEQEHNTSVIVTVPSVPYKFKIMGEKNIKKYRGEHITIINPCEYPDEVIITEKREPMVIGTVITPTDHISTVTNLCMARRGEQESFSYIDEKRAMIKFKMPLSEIIIDFYDELKATTSGYASFDYEDAGYEVANLVKMRFLLNSVELDELTHIVNLGGARDTGRRICEKLRDSIPRQLFDIMIQAVVGGKVLARENIKALKKNVLAKCYGGDISRKMKLLKRQAEGKKRMRKIGNISVPRDVFITVLKR